MTGCRGLPPVAARLPEATFHSYDPALAAQGVRAWQTCHRELPELLGIDGAWEGPVVFLRDEIPGEPCASFDGKTIHVGTELQGSEIPCWLLPGRASS
jgi:hypothetical protein